jgi:predicted metal-dependent enzyme (double-stranded beta helix superfamily)
LLQTLLLAPLLLAVNHAHLMWAATALILAAGCHRVFSAPALLSSPARGHPLAQPAASKDVITALQLTNIHTFANLPPAASRIKLCMMQAAVGDCGSGGSSSSAAGAMLACR